MKKLELKELDFLPFSVKESMNRLRVNLGYSGDQYKRILITSSIPDEGKSFVAVNLWHLLANSGKKVVLVDADLRRSFLRSRHKMQIDVRGDAVGLVNYLAGQVELEDVLYETNVMDGFIVPSFRDASNPLILLQNPRFKQMLDHLAENYDYVLLDVPPLDNVSDGLQMASCCDGALLVVKSGAVPRRLIASSIKQLEDVNCPIIGTVLNQVEMNKTPYYYRYSRYGYYNKYYQSEKNN